MGILIARRALLLVALAGCFSPTETDGKLRCGDAGCPSGFTCGIDGFCWRPGHEPSDAAASIDAEPPPADAAVPACSNGIDDDCDGKIDREDPGCASGLDNSELGTKKCDNGIDDDNDGYVDFRLAECLSPGSPPPDPGCDKPDDDGE